MMIFQKIKQIFTDLFSFQEFADKSFEKIKTIEFGQDLDIERMRKFESNLFLNRFSEHDLLKFMRKAGLIDYLNKLGFSNLIIKISQDELLVNDLKVYNKKVNNKNLLINIKVSESRFVPGKKYIESLKTKSYDMVVIEWLYTKNPDQLKFTHEKPQLPGQKRPGLGCLKKMMVMLYHVTRQFTKDGFLDVPDHFYLSLMYAKRFKFFDPEQQAIMKAIMRDLKEYSLSEISWGEITGTIKSIQDNQPFVYRPSEQIFYVSKRMRKYFKSKEYKKIFKAKFKESGYYFDYDEMLKKKRELLKRKKVSEL